MGSISAPVFDHAGRLACAVGLGFPTQRIGAADVERLGPVVARAGLEASRALGYAGHDVKPRLRGFHKRPVLVNTHQ